MTTLRQKIVAFVSERKSATAADVAKAMPGVKPASISAALSTSVNKGDLFVLVKRKGRTPSVYASVVEVETDDSNHVCEECRQNWQGYHIHKIFGSASRAC